MSEETADYDCYAGYDSGPFCRHWDDPSECGERCLSCQHRCVDHEFGDSAECDEDGCECRGWAE